MSWWNEDLTSLLMYKFHYKQVKYSTYFHRMVCCCPQCQLLIGFHLWNMCWRHKDLLADKEKLWDEIKVYLFNFSIFIDIIVSCSILPYPALTICVLCSIRSMFMDFGWLWELDSAVYMIHIVYMEYLFCLGIKVDCFCFFFWIWLCVEHKGFELFARGKILWSWTVFDRAKRKQIGWCQVLWQIIVPLLKGITKRQRSWQVLSVLLML